MLILRIRQAECALSDGRIDEAFELVQGEDIRRHRRGQKLVGRVVRALVDRGRGHLEAERLSEALTDCDKAGRCGGNATEIAHLRTDIAEAMADKQRADREHGGLVAAAREHIENGRISMGEQLLDDVNRKSGRVDALQRKAVRRREGASAAVREVEHALDRGDWCDAVAKLLDARKADLMDARLSELKTRTVKLATDEIRARIVEGRPDLAEGAMNRLTPLDSAGPETEELAAVLAQLRQSRQLIEAGEPRQAAQILRRMCTVLPRARWLDAAVRGCEAAADSLETLEVGPLGLIGPGGGDETIRLPAQGEHEEAVPMSPSPRSRPPERTAATLPQKFLIQVDGVGSFLVLRGESVTIGPISSSERPEVGLMADPALPAVTIERADEDYFLRCGRPVTVNDQPTTERLLADGDRIALSPRCRWRFLRPNAASTSAVLAISGARLPQADTRKVILLDREIIIGPGPTAHIRADRWDGSAVLHVRNGHLLCRSQAPVSADGLKITAGDPLPLSVPLQIGSMSLIVTPA